MTFMFLGSSEEFARVIILSLTLLIFSLLSELMGRRRIVREGLIFGLTDLVENWIDLFVV